MFRIIERVDLKRKMLEKAQIISLVKQHIKLFNPFEFCDYGGWPIFDHLDVIILSQTEIESGIKINLSILYVCEHPASCSCYSEITKPNTLDKEICIGNDGSFKVM